MPRAKAFDETETLQKAMFVFWKKGFYATSMEDLVAAMGINRASLYDTFGDKKQLFLAALQHFQQANKLQNLNAAKLSSGTPKAVLWAILSANLEESLEDKEQKGCMLANATSELALLDTDVCQFVQMNLQQSEDNFEQLIIAGQALGEFKEDINPKVAATTLINYVHGMRVVSKITQNPDRMRQGLEWMYEALCLPTHALKY